MTLVELVISIVIIGIAVAALYSAMASITGRSADPMLRQQALSIAEAYLEEISLQSFPTSTNCAASANGSGRAGFDDVCDYNGLTYPGAQPLAPRSAFSISPIAGLEGYRVQVQVAPVTLNSLSAANALRILVTVTDPAGQDLSLAGYRARY
ncbi:type II secretion system GspH family protein [Pseudomonas stutzeri]|nr:type II secretion system GspH family protein [Stutzerimonas stutzeri]